MSDTQDWNSFIKRPKSDAEVEALSDRDKSALISYLMDENLRLLMKIKVLEEHQASVLGFGTGR
jgi:hypothetical protein